MNLWTPCTTLFFYNLLFGACACAFFRMGSNLVALQPLLAFTLPSQKTIYLLHHIPLNLQLPAHKQLLSIRLALNQLLELGVVEDKCDGSLLALGRDAAAHSATFLEVDVPGLFLAGVLQCEGEDAVSGLDGGFAVGGGGGEGGFDCVEGGGGGEVGCGEC